MEKEMIPPLALQSVPKIIDFFMDMFEYFNKFQYLPSRYQRHLERIQDDLLHQTRIFYEAFRRQSLERQIATRYHADLFVHNLVFERNSLLAIMWSNAEESVSKVDQSLSSVRHRVRGPRNLAEISEIFEEIRINFADIMSILNFFLLIKHDFNANTKDLQKFVTKKNPILLKLVEKILILSMEFLKEASSADEMINSSDVRYFKLFFTFLVELKTGVYVGSFDCVAIENNVVKNLPLFSKNYYDGLFHTLQVVIQPVIKQCENRLLYRKRLRSGDREKVESYTLDVQQLITKNSSFLNDFVRPVLEDLTQSSQQFRSVKLIFFEEVLVIFKQKIDSDLPKWTSFDDDLLVSTITKLVEFVEKISDIAVDFFSDRTSLNPLNMVFENSEIQERYFEFVKNRLLTYIDLVLQSRWWRFRTRNANDVYPDHMFDKDDLYVTEAAWRFAWAIENLIEEARFLPNRARSIQFDMIIHACHHFFDTFVQEGRKINDFDCRFFRVLCTLGTLSPYIARIAEMFYSSPHRDEVFDWGKVQEDNERVSEKFKDTIEDMFVEMLDSFIPDLRSHLLIYKNLRWSSMQGSIDNLQMTCIAKRLFNHMNKFEWGIQYCPKEIREDFRRRMKFELLDILYEQLILITKFSTTAIYQLRHDIAHGLDLPGLAMTPIGDMDITCEALDYFYLLELPSETRQNLRERFRTSSEQEFTEFLETLKIYTLKPRIVMDIIDGRLGYAIFN